MRWSVGEGQPAKAAGNLLVLPVVEDDKAGQVELAKVLGKKEAGRWRKTLAAAGFKGAAKSWQTLNGAAVAADWILLVGLGPRDRIDLDMVRCAAAVAARQARAMGGKILLVSWPSGHLGGYDQCTLARCWVEGSELALDKVAPVAAGSTRRAKEADAQTPQRGNILVSERRAVTAARTGVSEGQAFAAGTLLARRLVNLPPNHLTPRLLANEARRLARGADMKCTVLGPARLRELKMGGLLGVSKGSREEPRLIVLEAAPRGGRKLPLIALVGKGVTFDAGGISLKPAAKMDEMKADMAGAAAVLGALATVAQLNMPVRVIGVIPATENLPDGAAIKPADVLLTAAGKTVEVLNTDAEGRLILADALHYACQRKPDFVIDVATLTGSCALALGGHFAGLMSTSGELIEVLQQAGGETFERVWHLPLIDKHREAMKGSVSDLKNLGGRDAGMSTAAGFLSHFVPENIAWAHLDIAGTAWSRAKGDLGPQGATGFGSRLLARTVQILGS